MTKLVLVPLEDIVVFPNMNVTLTVDVGDADRVLLVPQHEGAYASVGTVAEVTDRVRLPGGAHAVALNGLHRGVAGAAETDPRGRLLVEVDERPDEALPPVQARELEQEYRAVVEEILELRGDDGRIASFVRSISEPGALADTAGYSPELTFEQKVELLETLDVRERLELSLRFQRAARDHAGAAAHPRGRQPRGREAAARVHPAPPARVDPQGARRGRRLGRRRVPHEDRRGRYARRGAEQADRDRPLERMGEGSPDADDPQLPRLAARRAVGKRPRSGSTRSTTRRCSTPTMPASRT